jgi:hypothetical protein
MNKVIHYYRHHLDATVKLALLAAVAGVAVAVLFSLAWVWYGLVNSLLVVTTVLVLSVVVAGVVTRADRRA